LNSQLPPEIIIQIYSIISLLFLDLVAMGYIYKCKGDLVGAGVIVITLFGIALQQDDMIVHWVSLIFGIKTTIIMFHYYIKNYFRIRDEQTPLLDSQNFYQNLNYIQCS
ncbi:11554_t:CDS:2, partial [Scutellospora calospora]